MSAASNLTRHIENVVGLTAGKPWYRAVIHVETLQRAIELATASTGPEWRLDSSRFIAVTAVVETTDPEWFADLERKVLGADA